MYLVYVRRTLPSQRLTTDRNFLWHAIAAVFHVYFLYYNIPTLDLLNKNLDFQTLFSLYGYTQLPE